MVKMMPQMTWYYSKNAVQLGPVTEEELKAKASAGEILPNDLVWKEGMADWKAFGQIAEFQGSGMIPQAPVYGQAGSVAMPQPSAYPSGYSQNIPNYLWQSIVATVLGALTCWLVALPLGIVAIVFASKVEGLQRSGDIAGANAASKSAKAWMLGSFAVFALCIIAFIVMMVALAASGEL